MFLFLTGFYELIVQAVLDLWVGRVQCYRINLLNHDLALFTSGPCQLLLAFLLESIRLCSLFLLFFRLLHCRLLHASLYLHFSVLLALLIKFCLLVAHLCDGLLLTVVESTIVLEIPFDLVVREITRKHCHELFDVCFWDTCLLYKI